MAKAVRDMVPGVIVSGGASRSSAKDIGHYILPKTPLLLKSSLIGGTALVFVRADMAA
jgi:hypothetical protein